MHGTLTLLVRAYLSNISRAWSFERQEALLARKLPGWPDVPTYRDELHPKVRRAHQSASLKQRAFMLRPTSRGVAETIYVASPGVLAWSIAEFESVLDAAEIRRATIIALNTGLEIAPGADRAAAIEAFRNAKQHDQREAAAKSGAEISKIRRRNASDMRIALIRDRWGLPSAEWATADLLAECGLSRNTVQERLGKRPIAQFLYQRALKRRKVKNNEQA